MNRLPILLVLVGLFVSPCVAQGNGQPDDAVPVAYASPRATMQTFLEAMIGGDVAAGAACLDAASLSRDAAETLADKLYRCLNRIEEVDVSWYPEENRLRGPRESEGLWRVFPHDERNEQRPTLESARRFREVVSRAPSAQIALARQADGSWLFSSDTVTSVEDLFDRIGDLEAVAGSNTITLSQRIQSLWPSSFRTKSFLLVKWWQWGTILVVIFAGIVLDFSLRFLLVNISRRLITRRGGEARPESLKRTVRPFGLALAALVWLWAVPHLDLKTAVLDFVMPAVRLFAMLAMVWAAYRVTDLVSEVASGKAEKTDTKFDDLLIPLIRKTIKIFITIFGIIYIADSLNVPIAPLLTGLGIGGAGFAFAAKDTLEHFFGSVTVIADRPFQVGDWVQIGDVEGTVEEVGFRSTRVRTFYNSLMTVPNGNLVRAIVDNYGQRKYRRWKTHLNLAYGTPPDVIEAFCEGVRELIRVHPYTRKDYYQVWMHQLGPHSLDVLVYMFFECPEWSTELRERHRFILDVLRLADKLGVEFAFPTQTLHVSHQEEPQRDPPVVEAPPRAADFRAMRVGRKAVREMTANATWRERKPDPFRFGAEDDGDDDDTQIESKVGGSA